MKKIFLFIIIISISICGYSNKLKPLTNNYLIVVGDKVNLRSDSNLNSQVIRQLIISSEIKLLKKSGKKYKKGKIFGEWVFVDTGIYNKDQTSTIKGWVVDYFLSDTDKFKKLKKFKNCSLENTVGDSLLSYKFYKNGKFTRRDLDTKNRSVNIKGSLYRYRDVLIAHDEKVLGKGVGLVDMIFYINKKGNICSKEYDGDGKQICAICK